MKPTSPPVWPQALTDVVAHAARPRDDEIAALQALIAAGIPVSHVIVVPGDVEERFYRLNNLPSRLVALFADVDPTDPDEDDLEELAPTAMQLIDRHFLLDEFIDAFYERIASLPTRVRVRRPGRDGLEAVRGRPALLALKRLWAADWTFEALALRVGREGTFAIEARPVLVHGTDAPAPRGLAERVESALGPGFGVWATGDGVTRAIFQGEPNLQSGARDDEGQATDGIANEGARS